MEVLFKPPILILASVINRFFFAFTTFLLTLKCSQPRFSIGRSLGTFLRSYLILHMRLKRIPLIIFCFFLISFSYGQTLEPGFDAQEYLQVLAIAFGKNEDVQYSSPPPATAFARAYQSHVVGLDNRWELWLRNDEKQVIISIRGTVATTTSWLANVYAAMQPATGTITLNDTTTFHYKLADYPNATVHSGWLISLGAMAGDIEEKIKDYYRKGVKDFILSGHSQGGAITYLLRSYLYYRTKAGALPADITYKTYCSAAPKPGNMYYAYDFDFINRNGWAFTVVNAADWVPELPFSIQQLSDLNALNPFTDIQASLRKQKPMVRFYAGMVYKKLDRSTRKAQRRYQKYLGKKVGKQVKKALPKMHPQEFANTMNYMRAGTPVILMPDAAYFEDFPNDTKKRAGIWRHHSYNAYERLTKEYYLPD